MPEPKPVEQTARDVKTEVDGGRLNEGSEALRQGYLDHMRNGGDSAEFWTKLKTTGHLSDGDLQNLALSFARSNFDAMSEGSWSGTRFVTQESINRFDAHLRNGGNTPEAQFAQQMDRYLQKALQTDGAFDHGFFNADWETNFHGTGKYISMDALNSRIAAVNTEDRGRAMAGETARALDAKGPDGRTLFERLSNGKPEIMPLDLRAAQRNIGAYSPAEQEFIKRMVKGMDDRESPEGLALQRLQDPSKTNAITRERLNAINNDASTRPAETAPATPALTPEAARGALGAIVELPNEAREKMAKDGGFTRQGVDAYLKDQNNQMSVNQRQALEKFRDALPADNKPMTLPELAVAAGFKGADGQPDRAKVNEFLAERRAAGSGLLTSIKENVTAASITDQSGNITKESIAARMKAIQDAAAQPGGAPLAGNNEYTALQRLNERFNDMSADGQKITRADLDRFSGANAPDGKFPGFKEAGAGQRPPVETPPGVNPEQIKADGDALAGSAPGTSFKLGRGPIIDQAMRALQERAKTTGEPVTPQAARQLLADIAKTNKWPGTEAQWSAYVADGKISHLPKALNGALRSGMDVQVPGGANASPQQLERQILQKAQERVPAPNLQLTPAQIAEVKQKVPQAAQATPEQINNYIANRPEVLGDHLTAQQKAAIEQRNAQVSAYGKALAEYIAQKRRQATPPAAAPAA